MKADDENTNDDNNHETNHSHLSNSVLELLQVTAEVENRFASDMVAEHGSSMQPNQLLTGGPLTAKGGLEYHCSTIRKTMQEEDGKDKYEGDGKQDPVMKKLDVVLKALETLMTVVVNNMTGKSLDRSFMVDLETQNRKINRIVKEEVKEAVEDDGIKFDEVVGKKVWMKGRVKKMFYDWWLWVLGDSRQRCVLPRKSDGGSQMAASRHLCMGASD